MTNKLITLLFATFLMAEDSKLLLENNTTDMNNTIATIEIVTQPNPNVYASLGNVVYDNVGYIDKLQYIARYSDKVQKIQNYVEDVNRTKKVGYSIEEGKKTVTKGDYLKEIRALSKRNDEFKRDIVKSYKSSMTYKDNGFFSEIINSGLLDTAKYRSEIMAYYMDNNVSIDPAGVIQDNLDEVVLLEKQKEEAKRPVITRKQIQDAKIKRIRQNDKNKEAKIEKELEDEFVQKKSDILKEQREELAR